MVWVCISTTGAGDHDKNISLVFEHDSDPKRPVNSVKPYLDRGENHNQGLTSPVPGPQLTEAVQDHLDMEKKGKCPLKCVENYS